MWMELHRTITCCCDNSCSELLHLLCSGCVALCMSLISKLAHAPHKLRLAGTGCISISEELSCKLAPQAKRQLVAIADACAQTCKRI